MDEQQQRLERLRARRDSLTAAASPEEAAALDAEIAEAESQSLLGSGAPRTDTRELTGDQARLYVGAMMRHGPHGVNARTIRADAIAGTHRAINRLRLAVCRIRTIAHARMSVPQRRPGRVRTVRRARRGPARAASALPRPATPFGAIDGLWFFDRALTRAEVEARYA